jgi:hypothetical protein
LSGAKLCIGSRFEDTNHSFHIGLLFFRCVGATKD